MTRLLHLRSIRAAVARGERRLADLDGKRTELVGSIEELRDMLPEAERPVAYIRGAPVFASPNLQPDHREQLKVDLAGTGDDPKALQTTDAQGQRVIRDIIAQIDASAQSVGTDVSPLTEQDIREVVDSFKTTPGLDLPPVLVVPLVALVDELPRKRGWPLGLSRKRTPCPHSPIVHRHRANGDEMTCVGITYPE